MRNRQHLVLSTTASTKLLLLKLCLSSALQQGPACSSLLQPRRHVSFGCPTRCFLGSVAADETHLKEEEKEITYDWDEQFEELQSFMSKYGHCNFPQNGPSKLTGKHPTLARFCHDQRLSYKRQQDNQFRRNGDRMSLFDCKICCRRLQELGFEFNMNTAKWYDHYHELVEFHTVHGHCRANVAENPPLYDWGRRQRSRHRDGSLSETQIDLLNRIHFPWEYLHENLWYAKYSQLVKFKSKHGHFVVEHDGDLYKWMQYQRTRRESERNLCPPLSDTQIRLLDDIEFPWKGVDRYDVMWKKQYNELKRVYEKHGNPTYKSRQYDWSIVQRNKNAKGLLSTEQIELLDKINFSWELPKNWQFMYKELCAFVKSHGHVRVSGDDDPDLYDWMAIQRQRYHGIVKPEMTDQQIEKLEEYHFCWSLDWKERTWHEQYTEVAEFFKQHGHVRVTKKENPGLHNWVQMQEKRYKELKGQRPLSEEELEMLEQLDFPFLDGEPRMAWNAMYAEVTKYREENDGRFPTSHKIDPDLNRWMRRQRHRLRYAYGYAPLREEQKSLLESINFPYDPEDKLLRLWYEMYDELVDFWKQRGHFVVDRRKHGSLAQWVARQRLRYQGSSYNSPPLSIMQLYLLERIGFRWTSNREEIEWQLVYDQLVEFLESRGRFPSFSEHPKLSRWASRQRTRRKPDQRRTNNELSEYQIQQLDKIGFRW